MRPVKRSSLFILKLVLLSWTASFAQSPKGNTDTIKCYGVTELREIASCFIELDACDTLLSNAKSMLANRDSMIKEKDGEIYSQSLQLILKEKIITDNHNQIDNLTNQLNTVKTHRKLLGIGWGSTSLVFVGMIFYLAIH